MEKRDRERERRGKGDYVLRVAKLHSLYLNKSLNSRERLTGGSPARDFYHAERSALGVARFIAQIAIEVGEKQRGDLDHKMHEGYNYIMADLPVESVE